MPPVADRWRYAPRTALIAVIALLLAGFLSVAINDRLYNEQQRSDAQTQANVLAASVTAALDFRDRAAAQEYAGALAANPRVTRAGIYDAQGKLFAGYARAGGTVPTSLAASEVDGPGTFGATASIMRGSDRLGTVRLAVATDPLLRRVSRYSVIALLTVMAGLVVGILGLAQRTLQKANRDLADRARALAESNDQLKREMNERAKAEDQLRQAQKMQALGQLTGGIAHDFNNLLTVIQGSADLLRRPNISEERRVRHIEAIAQTAERAASLTSQLLSFGRRQPLQPKVLDLNLRLRGMMKMVDRVLDSNVRTELVLSSDACAVDVDPTQLEVAILNIVVNARDAMPDGGTITIATGNISGENLVEMVISDTGTGMDAETAARAVEPFFTTKKVGKGTGLGLSQVYGFAAQSGGEVRIDSAIGEGTTVRLLLPCSPELPVVEDAARPRSGPEWHGTILFVEDNAEVAAFSKALLEEMGHRVIYAESGDAALELVQAGTAFDLLFTDVVMPGTSGLELAAEVKRIRPGTPILLATGYSERISDLGSHSFPVLTKPYRLDDLARAVEAAKDNA